MKRAPGDYLCIGVGPHWHQEGLSRRKLKLVVRCTELVDHFHSVSVSRGMKTAFEVDGLHRKTLRRKLVRYRGRGRLGHGNCDARRIRNN